MTCNRLRSGRFIRACAISIGASFSALLVVAPSLAIAEGACPNEQLRAETHSTSLPDCRAYEQVTPPFKYGNLPHVPSSSGPSPDGQSFFFTSLGLFGEPEGGAKGTYVAHRRPTGWFATPVNPPADRFYPGDAFQSSAEEVATVTADFSGGLGQSLFIAAPRTGGPGDYRFYTTSPAGITGGFTEVGPVRSPVTIASLTETEKQAVGVTVEGLYIGATASLDRIFFTINEDSRRAGALDYWPGDGTVANESLYSYEHAGETEPRLVGVAPGPRETQSRPAEAPTLVSSCGVVPGGGTQGLGGPRDGYNAVSTQPASEAGRSVFFTALAATEKCRGKGGTGPTVDELYARVAGSKTVAISEPSPADCAACNTFNTDRSRRSAAGFQGASADGSRVFFITTQQMFSGARGESNRNLYEYNFHAADPHKKVTLLAAQVVPYREAGPYGGVVRVTDEGSHVYFVSTGVLATNADALGRGPVLGNDNFYVRDTEANETRFIATLSPEDAELWQAQDNRPAQATPDGRFLVFQSAGNLTPGASGPGHQVYRYDAQTGALLRLSHSQAGINANGNDGGSFGIVATGHALPLAVPRPGTVSADGTRVVFSGPSALTPQALKHACAVEVVEYGTKFCQQEAPNVYEWEQAGTVGCSPAELAGCVHLVSDGQDTHSQLRGPAVNLLGISADGGDLFFTSADPLVAQDGDTQVDIYDARVNGGVSAPVGPSRCRGEACQEPRPLTPVLEVPSSTAVGAVGDLSTLVPVAVNRSKAAEHIRAERLDRALKACRAVKNKKRRSACRTRARKRYRPQRLAKAHAGTNRSAG